MVKIGRTLFFIMLFFCFKPLFAAPTMKLEMQPDQVGVGDRARLILTISNNEDFENEDPQLNPGSDYKILESVNGGRSNSSRMNIINGKTEFSKTVSQHYEYLVEFNKAGTITIGPISISIDALKKTVGPILVNVAKNSQQSNTQRNKTRGAFEDEDQFGQPVEDDMFSQLLKQRQKIFEEMQKQMQGGGSGLGQGLGGFGQDPAQIPSVKLDVNNNESFFIQADSDKTAAYEGEQVTVNWYIYVKGNIDSLDRAKFPDLKGFWKEIIEEVPGLQFSPVRVNGVDYKRALLASHALFPIKAGVAVIDEFKIKATVRNLTQFGWGQPHEFTKSSKRIPVQVNALPAEDKPLSFSGAVGQFQIQTQIDNLQVKAGQPFALKLRFEGYGNAKLIELPPINWPENLSLFDTKSNSKFFKNGQSFKEFELLLVQSKKGEFKIPVIQFSYFDPQLKKYVTKSTEELQLSALEADPQTAIKNSSSSGVVNEVNKEIGPLLVWPSNFSWKKKRNTIFVGVILIFILAFCTLLYRALSQIKSNPTHQERLKAKIQKIESAIANQNYQQVGSESVNLIYLLLEHLLGKASGGQIGVESDFYQKLNDLPLDLKQRYQTQLTDAFQYFQMIGFAPEQFRKQTFDQNDLIKQFETLKKIISE